MSEIGAAPFDPLAALLGGYETTRIICAFVELGVADELGSGPQATEELAARLDLDADALRRLLRALVPLRIVAEHEDGGVGLTARGERLRSDVSGSLRAVALAPSQEWWWGSWMSLADAIRTGRSGYEVRHERPVYDALAQDPGAAELYAQYMAAFRADELEQVASAYDFESARVVVDVGGGTGALLEQVLRRHPHLSGVLLDVETMAAAASRYLAAAGLAARVDVVAGDFFADVPPGGDVYLLRQVLHDWDDERAVRLLDRVRTAIGATGSLVIVQHVLPDDGRSSSAAFIDIALLVLTGGRERTLAEYTALLERAGLALTGSRTTPSGATLLGAAPA